MNDAARWLTAYVINSTWQIPVLAVGTWGLVRIAARGGARLHYRLWVGCFVLAIVLPAQPRVGRLPDFGFGWHGAHAARVVISSGTEQATSEGGWVSLWAEELVAFAKKSGAGEFLLGFYGLSLLVGAVKLLRELRATRDVVIRAFRVALPPSVASSLLLSAETLGIAPVEVYGSVDLRCPATVSWPRAMLLVPEDFSSVADEVAAAAIRHELAHVQRHDFAANLVYEALALFAFYHPALHWIKARLADSREVVCDEMAADAATSRTAYARSLLSLAETAALQSSAQTLLLGVLETTTIERRIMKLVEDRLPLSRPYRMLSAAGCWVLLGGLSVGVLTLSIRRSAAETARAESKVPALAAHPIRQMQLAMNAPGDAAIPPEPADDGVRTIGGDVVAPVVIDSVNPEFTEEARKAKFMGVVTVGLVVDRQGMPTDVHLVRGVGLGLDENAVDAVRQYRFRPAMENGEPVRVALNVEVNYQIF